MNKELIEKILKDISTPTGLSYSEDQTIANSTVENILEFIDELQKKAELGEHYKHLYSEVKKQKDDVVEFLNTTDTFVSNVGKEKILRMLGEIGEENIN